MTIDGLTFATLAPSTLAGLAVLMVMTGRLIPRKTYDDIVRSNETKDKQIAEKDVQLAHLAEVGKTVEAIMHSIQRERTTSMEGDDR